MGCHIEAQGIINKNTLTEIRVFLIPPFIPVVTILLSIIFVGMFLIYVARSMVIALIFLFCVVAIYMTYRYTLIAVVAQNLYILEILFQTRDLTYSLKFGEDKLYVFIQGKEPIDISYLQFYRITETQNYYIMMFGGRIPVIIDKKTFSTSKTYWKEFINRKCVNLKNRK